MTCESPSNLKNIEYSRRRQPSGIRLIQQMKHLRQPRKNRTVSNIFDNPLFRKVELCRSIANYDRSMFIKWLSHYERAHCSIGVFRWEYVNTVVTFQGETYLRATTEGWTYYDREWKRTYFKTRTRVTTSPLPWSSMLKKFLFKKISSILIPKSSAKNTRKTNLKAEIG